MSQRRKQAQGSNEMASNTVEIAHMEWNIEVSSLDNWVIYFMQSLLIAARSKVIFYDSLHFSTTPIPNHPAKKKQQEENE